MNSICAWTLVWEFSARRKTYLNPRLVMEMSEETGANHTLWLRSATSEAGKVIPEL